MAISDKLSSLRKRAQRREKGIRGKRRARSRRIERGEPEGVAETVAVSGRQTKQSLSKTREEAKGLASDVSSLGSTAVGIGGDDDDLLLGAAGDALSTVGEAADSLDPDALVDPDGGDVLGDEPIGPVGGDLGSGGMDAEIGLGGDESIEALDFGGGSASDDLEDLL